jgi:hypothetical protein
LRLGLKASGFHWQTFTARLLKLQFRSDMKSKAASLYAKQWGFAWCEHRASPFESHVSKGYDCAPGSIGMGDSALCRELRDVLPEGP